MSLNCLVFFWCTLAIIVVFSLHFLQVCPFFSDGIHNFFSIIDAFLDCVIYVPTFFFGIINATNDNILKSTNYFVISACVLLAYNFAKKMINLYEKVKR